MQGLRIRGVSLLAKLYKVLRNAIRRYGTELNHCCVEGQKRLRKAIAYGKATIWTSKLRMLEGKNMKTVKRKPLIGERIILRPFSKKDLTHIMRWSNDAELRKLTGEIAPISQAEAEKFYKELRIDETRAWYTIVVKKDSRVIGEAGLLRMFTPWRNTDMTIIIGEKDARRRGYGKEAGHLLLTHAFHNLGFHRISVGVVGFNTTAIRFWKSLGFRKEGVEREEYYCDNKYSDFVMMSMLENEYKQPPKK